MTKRKVQGRTPDEAVLTDSTCTPKWLADRLHDECGLFDLDPASNPRSHIRAARTYSLEQKLDGLRLPWRGRVFRNNPFSYPDPWCTKALYEMSIGRCTELINLCKLDTSTVWWQDATAPIERDGDLWYPDRWEFFKRVHYEEHPEIVEGRRLALEAWKASDKTEKRPPSVKAQNNFCSVLIHHRFNAPRLKLDDIAMLWVRGNTNWETPP